MDAMKHLVNDRGFLLFLEDFREKRARHYRTLVQNQDQMLMVRSAGRVEVLDEVLSWADKTVEAGNEAKRVLRTSPRGDNSDEESQ